MPHDGPHKAQVQLQSASEFVTDGGQISLRAQSWGFGGHRRADIPVRSNVGTVNRLGFTSRASVCSLLRTGMSARR
jgi:hypothetical protein